MKILFKFPNLIANKFYTILLVFLLIFSFFPTTLLAANSLAIPTFKDINVKEIQNIFYAQSSKYGSENILGLWDVDMVLTQPKNSEAQMKNILKYYENFKKIFSSLTNDEKQTALNLSTKIYPSILVDPLTPSIIKTLQKKNIKMLTLTDSYTGKLDQIESVEKWRYEELKRLGYDFSVSFCDLEKIVFNELKKFRNSYPMYYKGNLLANAEYKIPNKANTLKAFIHKTKFQPKAIIFIDDQKNNLKDIEQFVLDFFKGNVKFIGVHYQYTSKANTPDVTLEQFTEFWEKVANIAKIEACTTKNNKTVN